MDIRVYKLDFTVRNFCALTFTTCSRLKQIKSWINSLLDHLFFYRLWHIRSFIHPSLDIIYGFRLNARKIRLWYTHIEPFLCKSEIISIRPRKVDYLFACLRKGVHPENIDAFDWLIYILAYLFNLFQIF